MLAFGSQLTFTGNIPCMSEEISHTSPLSDLVRRARKNIDLTQSELGEAIGKSRWWIVQLEKGAWYVNGKGFALEPMMCLKLADVLGLDPVAVLSAADVPKNDWPDFSNMVAKSDSVRRIDITTLTPAQTRLVAGLVDEFKRGNNSHGIGKP